MSVVSSLNKDIEALNVAKKNEEKAILQADYNISIIDPKNPEAEDIKKEEEEDKKFATEAIKDIDESIKDIQEEIKEQEDGIKKIETGETKVSLDSLNDIAADLVAEVTKVATVEATKEDVK